MKRLTQDEFISKCKEKHGNRYDYSKVEYINTRSKVAIFCKEHGDFKQLPKSHRLSFDFYLPELKTCIEFDGIQHFKPINDFGGKNEFKNVQKRDNCKNKWCEDNNIKLIRIKYNEIDRIKYIHEKLHRVEKK